MDRQTGGNAIASTALAMQALQRTVKTGATVVANDCGSWGFFVGL